MLVFVLLQQQKLINVYHIDQTLATSTIRLIFQIDKTVLESYGMKGLYFHP